MQKRWLLLVAGLMLGVVGVWSAGAQDALPQFAAGRCAAPMPPGQDVECGTVTVPEDRSNPDGATIELEVAIFRSDNPDKAPDPVVYLDGGPGSSSLETASLQFGALFQHFLGERDVILFDQRGIGVSRPALDCPEYGEVIYETLDTQLTAAEFLEQFGAVLEECAARLAGEDINLDAYTSAENAADVNDIRIALGYEQWNLYGISYGTKLALTVLRDHPEGVRSAIIDSVYPPQVSGFGPALTAQRAFNALFAACEAQATCNEAYPDLEAVFYELIDDLNQSPARIDVPDMRVLGTQQVEAVIDGDTAANVVFVSLYAADLIPTLPENIYAMRDGDFTLAATVLTLQLFQLDSVSWGMNQAVQCNEEFPFDSQATINDILDEIRPELVSWARKALVDPVQLSLCKAWSSDGPNPVENEPVSSDVPTLVAAGEFDPITPPAYAEMAAETLTNSTFVLFPGQGHGATVGTACAEGILSAFLADPTAALDTSCTAELGAVFDAPGVVTTSAPITWELFVNEDMGFETVVPEGWAELIPGTFARGGGGLDQTALTFQVLPGGGSDMVIGLLGSQFGLSTETAEEREANGLTWTLYQGEFANLPVDLAVGDGDGTAYIIILISNDADEREANYTEVLLPIVDGFKPL